MADEQDGSISGKNLEGINWASVVRYENGDLYWIKNPKHGHRLAGKPVGRKLDRDGNRTFIYQGRAYKFHRVVYELHFGPIPKGASVSHIDNDRGCNKIENLQLNSNEIAEQQARKPEAWRWKLLFQYQDGVLISRLNSPRGKRTAGKSTERNSPYGYKVVNVRNKPFFSHRIIYEMHYGSIPEGINIDHIDGNPKNNKIENLRLCNQSLNSANAKRRSDNTTGFKGVGLHRKTGKYRARIRIDGKTFHLGLFGTPEEAYLAYCRSASQAFGEFARFE